MTQTGIMGYRVWSVGFLTIMLSGLIFPGVAQADQAQKPSVFVGIAPQAYFVERIAGPGIDIGVLIGPGQSHEMYDPTPKDIARLSQADLYFEIGLPFEKRLVDRVMAMTGNFTAIDTEEGITLRSGEEAGHSHGAHSGEEGPDPHTWLDPQLVKIQGRNICNALKRQDPSRVEVYEANYAAFARDLDRVDSAIAVMLAPYAGRTIYVYHPAYGYFTDRYGLRQTAVELEGKEPGAENIASLITRARGERITTVFVQPEYSIKTAEAIARDIGAQVVALDPMARDYLKNLVIMAERIRASFGQAAAPGEKP